ncbi:hypothetical protein [Glaciecola petra]|uniref:Uncharacterized protein n=1 Tax=Glaciecola petra TaxID=3075602 RepID=A0ABU2ZPJ6_9ALTE|nr:hypothetical protein [Aestuariibacter sp. P117]MDT0594542.1 hypothetical protein [Aestuariibacter sp. P117]
MSGTNIAKWAILAKQTKGKLEQSKTKNDFEASLKLAEELIVYLEKLAFNNLQPKTNVLEIMQSIPNDKFEEYSVDAHIDSEIDRIHKSAQIESEKFKRSKGGRNSQWKEHEIFLTDLITKFIAGEIKNKVALKEHIHTEFNREPDSKTINKWITCYKETGDIFKE